MGGVHSAQFGDDAIVDVICLFSVFRLGLEDVSRRMISWRAEGASEKRRGRDILVVVVWRRRWFDDVWWWGLRW
jgi:hypothetical protein